MRCYRNSTKIFLLYFLHICTASVKKKNYKNFKVLELDGQNPDILTSIDYINAFDDSATYAVHGGKAQVLMRPSLVASFTNFAAHVGVNVKVLVSDFSKVLEQESKMTLRNKGNFSWTGYFDIDDIYTFLKTLQEEHPLSSTLILGGESYLGQKILGLRIVTKAPLPENQTKPVVMIESGIHAREWLTPAVTTYFINELLNNNHDDFTRLRDSFDWHVFPSVNPDGYRYSLSTERMWRKSRARYPNTACIGADLNRNWDYKFGGSDVSNDPCSYDLHAGSSPFSEIETRSLSYYISKLDNLLVYLAVHTFGRFIIIPENVFNRSQMLQVARSAVKRSGVHYDIGTSKEFFGDNVSGTSKDWVYTVKKPPIVFTLELRGDTFFTPSSEIIKSANETALLLIGLFEEAERQSLYQRALKKEF